MEKQTLSVQVNVDLEDGTAKFYILRNREDINVKNMRDILMGGLSLLVKSESTPELQGEALRDVIQKMEEEFVNVNSFDDVWLAKKLK